MKSSLGEPRFADRDRGRDEVSPAVAPAGYLIAWMSCTGSGSLGVCSVMKSTRSGSVWSAPSVVRAAPASNPDSDGTNVAYDSNGDVFFQPFSGGADIQLEIPGFERNRASRAA